MAEIVVNRQANLDKNGSIKNVSTGYGIHVSRYATEDPILSAVCEVCGIIESVARRSDTIVIHRVTASGH